MTRDVPRRVLFVSYLFPPAGGVGVHRVTKFVKYLPEFGWNSSVLTVANPSVPLHDESLLRDVPAGTILRCARTWEPGYALKQAVSGGASRNRRGSWAARRLKALARAFGNLLLQPDPQILWHPQAYHAGLQLLRDVRHDAIIATGPPFSSLMLGARLSRKTGLPLILDYRDEWDISNAYWENKGQGRLANWLQSRQQAHSVRAASVLLATTPSSAEAVERIGRRAGSTARGTFIYNGFDPDDYPQQRAGNAAPSPAGAGEGGKDGKRGTGKFRLAFIGTLWNLNPIEPLVEAVRLLASRHPHLAGDLELLLAGRRTGEQDAVIDRLNETPVSVTRLPFVSHTEAIQWMQSADALLMLNADLPQTQRIINAKTFEYMAARRPMFVVAPEGDVWDVVRDLPGTVLCRPGDVEAIASKLALVLEQHRCGIRHHDAGWDIARFHRRHLAEQLADLLDSVAATAPSPAPFLPLTV